MFNVLEEMRHDLPIAVKKFEESLEHQHLRRQLQNLCKHEYNEIKFREKRIKHCHRCHHTVFTHMRHYFPIYSDYKITKMEFAKKPFVDVDHNIFSTIKRF